MRGILHVRVAILAIQSQLPGMQTMAVLYGLFRRVADIGVLRGEVVPDDQDGEYAARQEGKVGQYVRLSGENLRHPGKGGSVGWNHRTEKPNNPPARMVAGRP